MSDYIDVVFDGPPSHTSGRFIEIENSEGESINFGEWIYRPDGYWVLRIPKEDNLPCPKCGKGRSSKHCIRCSFKEALGKAMDRAEQKIQEENTKQRPNCGQRPQNTIGVVPPKSSAFTFSSGQGYDITKLKECGKALVDKLNLIKKDGQMDSIFVFAATHGCTYYGPNYKQELEDLEKALNEKI